MAGGKAQRIGYVPYFLPAKRDPDYPDGQNRTLVANLDIFREVATQILGSNLTAVSWDTETTGLSSEECKLVGVSLATSSKNAYYFPVGHVVGDNVPLEPVLELLARINEKVKRVFFYNPIFDLRFLRAAGIEKFVKVENIKFFDVQAIVFNADTNISMPKLKWAADHFLGWNMQKFEEALGDKIDFSFNDPKDCYKYPCDDALATLLLPYRLSEVYKECEFVCKLDNMVTLPRMHMEDNPTRIDVRRLENMKSEIDTTMAEVEGKVYQAVGYAFKINSSQQLVKALDMLGLKTLRLTAGGKSGIRQSSTKEDALEEIEDQHPSIPLIIEYKKLLKLRSSYVESLLEHYRADLKGVRFPYFSYAVPSGRFASGGEKSKKVNSYFARLNVQSIPKSSQCVYEAVKSDSPQAILGYEFKQTSSKEGVEGFVSKNNVREAFLPEPDHYWVHADYSQEELRLPANFSGEPTWIVAYTNDEDIHTNMAIKIWGKENYTKDLRRKVKPVNFGALYGGSKWTFAKSIKCSLEEAQQLVEAWWAALPVLKRWVRGVERFAQKNGWVKTFFGRPRRLKFWYMSTDFKVRRFADRSAVNHIIQGTGADIIRYAMATIYIKLRKHIDSGDLIFRSTVHDELNFSIAKAKFHEIVPQIVDIMEIKVPNWKVQMKVEVSVGNSWGSIFPFKFVNSLGWTPVV